MSLNRTIIGLKEAISKEKQTDAQKFESNYYRIERCLMILEHSEMQKFESNYYRIEGTFQTGYERMYFKFDVNLKRFCVFHKQDFNMLTEEQRQNLVNHHGQALMIEDR